jgi:hypothetical protein
MGGAVVRMRPVTAYPATGAVPGENAFYPTLDESLVPHPYIEGFNRVRNRTCVGPVKECENFRRYLPDGLHT